MPTMIAFLKRAQPECREKRDHGWETTGRKDEKKKRQAGERQPLIPPSWAAGKKERNRMSVMKARVRSLISCGFLFKVWCTWTSLPAASWHLNASEEWLLSFTQAGGAFPVDEGHSCYWTVVKIHRTPVIPAICFQGKKAERGRSNGPNFLCSFPALTRDDMITRGQFAYFWFLIFLF